MKKKIIILLLFTNLYSSFYAQTVSTGIKNTTLRAVFQKILKYKDFKNAQLAFMAFDATKNTVIAAFNPDMALKPASTQKLFSTATAIDLYSPEYQFKTKIQYSGKIDAQRHILYGNLYITGGGDPTLGSKYFKETKTKLFLQQWTKAVKRLSIDSVAGAVIADAHFFSEDIVPQSSAWKDMGNYYGAGACGLTIYDDYYSIYFNSGSQYGLNTTISKVIPNIPNLSFDNKVISDTLNFDNAYIFGEPYSYNRYLRGGIPLNRTNFEVKGSIPDPAYFAALEFEKNLINNQIQIRDKATTIRLLKKKNINLKEKRNTIIITKSPKLAAIIAQTNIHSINLYAEHIMSLCGLKLTKASSTETASQAVMKYWEKKGMDIQGLSLTDGSGLSTDNTITPRQMVWLLRYMKNKSPNFTSFYNSLPIAGKSGTLKYMFRTTMAEKNLRAKSGTINRVKAYAGYVKSKSGEDIIFSVIVNNYTCLSREAKNQLEKIMIALAEL